MSIVVTVTGKKRDVRTGKRFSWSYNCGSDETAALSCAAHWREQGAKVALATIDEDNQKRTPAAGPIPGGGSRGCDSGGAPSLGSHHNMASVSRKRRSA